MVLFWASANMPERAVRMVMAIWMIMRQVSGGSFCFIGLVVRLLVGWCVSTRLLNSNAKVRPWDCGLRIFPKKNFIIS